MDQETAQRLEGAKQHIQHALDEEVGPIEAADAAIQLLKAAMDFAVRSSTADSGLL